MAEVAVRVTRVGWRATFTDLGRRNAEISGVPTGGAADQHSAVVANILVGNPRDAVLVEAIGDFGFVAPVAMLAAVTGAPASVTVDGAPAEQWHTLVVPARCELAVTGAHGALRSYVSIGGELQAPRFLGSAAPDPRMGFKQEIKEGQTIALRCPSAIAGLSEMARIPFTFDVPRLEFPDGPWFLDVVRAAEVDRVPEIEALLSAATYTVKPQSDHVGVRLAGPVRHPQGPEIVSHGVPIGAVEIPHADDELIVLGRYRTLTAGYPIVGIVARTDLALVGQLAGDTAVRFRWIERSQAVERAAEHEAALVALERSVTNAFSNVAQLGAWWWP
jgi:allophanate hydrolase subunit 2